MNVYDTIYISPKMYLVPIGVCMGRVKEIFWPNPPWWVKKNLTQPNPLHKSNPTQLNPYGLGWVELNPWVEQLFLLLLLLNWAKYIYIYIYHTYHLSW